MILYHCRIVLVLVFVILVFLPLKLVLFVMENICQCLSRLNTYLDDHLDVWSGESP